MVEASCNGYVYSGSWTGRVFEDCTFNGTDNWDFVSGIINPATMILTTGVACKTDVAQLP